MNVPATRQDVDLKNRVLSGARPVRDAGQLKTIKSHRRLALPALAATDVAVLSDHVEPFGRLPGGAA